MARPWQLNRQLNKQFNWFREESSKLLRSCSGSSEAYRSCDSPTTSHSGWPNEINTAFRFVSWRVSSNCRVKWIEMVRIYLLNFGLAKTSITIRAFSNEFDEIHTWFCIVARGKQEEKCGNFWNAYHHRWRCICYGDDFDAHRDESTMDHIGSARNHMKPVT